MAKNGTKFFSREFKSGRLSLCPARLRDGERGRHIGRDRDRQRGNEWAVINMLQSGCISEGHWEETTGHYSTTKGLLISLLGFN